MSHDLYLVAGDTEDAVRGPRPGYGVGVRKRERKRGDRERREGERETTGYEPFEMHAAIHYAILGGVIETPSVWGLIT